MSKSTSKLESKRNVIIAIIAAIIILSTILVIRYQPDLATEHEHTRFKVYINTQQINFNPDVKPQFHNVDERIFLDGQNGHTIHRFAKDVTLGEFFESIGMSFTSSCFILDEPLLNQKEFCNAGDKTLKFLVNAEPNFEYENYVIKDGDRFLISYGNQTDEIVQKQMDSVGS